MKKDVIIVTGGSGMVGKSLQEILPDAIYLNSSSYNLTSEKEVAELFWDYKPDIIIHLAAKVGGIIDNINKPAEYFTDNILMNTHLVDFARGHDVKRFIGILSTCIYPDVLPDNSYPLTEDLLHAGPPTATNFSYGYAKRSLAVQIDAYNKQYGTRYQYLTPCNLYGEFDKYGDNSHFVSALIKKIILAKENDDTSITLYGTGKPLRQFMYSHDLAYIIKQCLDNDIYDSFNVATKEIHSIDEIARIALKACYADDLEIIYDSSKPDGQFRKDVSIEKLEKTIPDFVQTSLFDGIRNTYEYLMQNKTLLTK